MRLLRIIIYISALALPTNLPAEDGVRMPENSDSTVLSARVPERPRIEPFHFEPSSPYSSQPWQKNILSDMGNPPQIKFKADRPSSTGNAPRWNNSRIIYRPNAEIATWSGAGIGAFSSREHYPGLMSVESGGLYAYRNFGPVRAEINTFAEKYGYFRGLTTVYGAGGSIRWQINERLSLHGFGSFQKSIMLPPAMAGFAGTSYYGGFLRWDTSDKFGIDMGAQNVYNPSLRHWEVAPIVRPYYKLGNGKTIGIDIGGILYGILKDSGVIDRNIYNPTIAPPSMHTPMPR